MRIAGRETSPDDGHDHGKEVLAPAELQRTSTLEGLLTSGTGNDVIEAIGPPPGAPRTQRLLLGKSEWSDDSGADRYLSQEGWATFEAHMALAPD